MYLPICYFLHFWGQKRKMSACKKLVKFKDTDSYFSYHQNAPVRSPQMCWAQSAILTYTQMNVQTILKQNYPHCTAVEQITSTYGGNYTIYYFFKCFENVCIRN